MNSSSDLSRNLERVWTARFDSSLGGIIMAATSKALLGVWFDGQKHFAGVQPDWVAASDHAVLNRTQVQLEQYFAAQLTQFDLPLAGVGTDFQQRVWQALLTIPYGRVVSYGQLATQLGAARAVRAVAAAIGRNPISVIVPCHRVIGANGSLTGYAGGLERKQTLLTLEEKVDAPL